MKNANIISIGISLGSFLTIAHAQTLPQAQVYQISQSTPDSVCSAYNANIESAKGWYDSQGIDSSFFDNKFCQYIEFYPGEDEFEVELSSLYINRYESDIYADITERMDVKNKVALLVFNDTKYTYYQLYSTADVGLKYQSLSYNSHPISSNTGLDLSLEYGLTYDGSYVKNYVRDSTASSCLAPTDTGASSECIPGGSANSPYWILLDTYPGTSYSTREYDISQAEQVGFSLSAGITDSGKPELSVSYENSYSTESGTQNDAFVSNQVSYENDIGFYTTFSTDNDVLQAVVKNGLPTNTADSNEALGENAWKALDLSSVTTWAQENNQATCKTMEISFINELGVARGGIGWDIKTGSKYGIEFDMTTVTPYALKVKTTCEDLGNGLYFRKLVSVDESKPEQLTTGFKNMNPVSKLDEGTNVNMKLYNRSTNCPMEWSSIFFNSDETTAKFDCGSKGDPMTLIPTDGLGDLTRFTSKVRSTIGNNYCYLEWDSEVDTLTTSGLKTSPYYSTVPRLRRAQFDCGGGQGDGFIFEEVAGEPNVYTIEAQDRPGCYLTTSSGVMANVFPGRQTGKGKTKGWMTNFYYDDYILAFYPLETSKMAAGLKDGRGYSLSQEETAAYFDCTPYAGKDTFYLAK